MNKTLKSIILAAAMLSFVGSVEAQSRYYHLVGDTVFGKSPIYYYDWWPNVDSLGRLPDSTIQSHWPGGTFYRHITTDTLKIIGIASTMSRMNGEDHAHPFEECDPTMDTTMYYILFNATPAGPVELARVCWTDDYNTHPKRYMALPKTYSAHTDNRDKYCELLNVDNNITSLREYYFSSPIIVTDSFYLGWQHMQRYPNNSASGEALCRYLSLHYYSDAELHQYQTYFPNDCTQKIPLQRIMYRNQQGNWVFTTDDTKYSLVFPIIEVDTVGLPYDTSLFSCSTPETPTIITRDNSWVHIKWRDNSNNETWTVSVTALDDDPDNGRMTITSDNTSFFVMGLSPDTAYSIYVKGWCQTSMWEGWSDWSAPLTLDAISSQEGIATPNVERFSLSPNPASGTVIVSTEETQGTLTIVDMGGRELHTQTFKKSSSQTIVLDISSLSSGTYIVTLDTPRGQTSKKLTVN